MKIYDKLELNSLTRRIYYGKKANNPFSYTFLINGIYIGDSLGNDATVQYI